MKTTPGNICTPLLLVAINLLLVGQALAQEAPPPRKAAFATPPLAGNATVNSRAIRLLDEAAQAIQNRFYKEAEKKYQLVVKEIHRGFHDPKAACLTRIGLAEVELHGNEDAQAALKTFASAQQLCDTTYGASSEQMARLEFGTAEAYLSEGKVDKALEHCKRSLAVRTQIDDESHETGVTIALLGRIEHARGFYKEAKETLSRALKILEVKPGVDMLDYANALYAFGLTRLAAGDEEGANAAIEKARGMQDLAVNLNKTPDRKGVVHFTWEDGVPECRQVFDSVYPLKYMIIDSLRIAVTLVRSDKHVGALVSLANCSREPMQVAVGPVVVEKTSPGSRSKMFYCDPGLIDTPLEEECVSNLTWRRRWLCHIQKTHRVPGYLKSGVLDPDNFYGNNVFGTYGCWDGSLKNAPPIVTREQFYFDSSNEKTLSYNDVERFMARSSGGFKPAFIDPGDARTGVIFFLRQRFDTARLRITLGNAVIDFPFQAVAGH